MIKALINNIEIEVKEGTSILDAAKTIGIKIPTLCYHPDLRATAACGICVVQIDSMGGKCVRACVTPLENKMVIKTHSNELHQVRRATLELILSAHPNECLTCLRNQSCELQQLAADFGINEIDFEYMLKRVGEDASTKSVVLYPDKCIKCGRCLVACQEMQDVHALTFLNRGFDTVFAPSANTLKESPCVDCGQCAAHCPVGAIYEYDQTAVLWEALSDKNKYTVVQIAPAVRVAIGEAFGFEVGTNITGKLYAALRRLGFDQIFDTNFGADLTIMEEASEFVQRYAHGKGLIPMITTCCPAWVLYMEEYYTDMLDHFSSAKSPHQMLGAMAKTYFAEKTEIEASKIYTVSIMPCTAKKNEIDKNEDMHSSGYQDVDLVITSRELARMIKQAGIDLNSLEDETADSILGEYTGAGTIFGATGGVMEAALRTAVYFATGENLEKVEFENVRGLEGVKETSVTVGGKEVRLAIAHGLKNVKHVLTKVRESIKNGGEPVYHFIEIMACPGGCVGGGGQPYGINDEIRAKRAKGLYQEDAECNIRASHENPYIQQLYKEFLGEPLGDKAHKLLHTHYKPKSKYNI